MCLSRPIYFQIGLFATLQKNCHEIASTGNTAVSYLVSFIFLSAGLEAIFPEDEKPRSIKFAYFSLPCKSSTTVDVGSVDSAYSLFLCCGRLHIFRPCYNVTSNPNRGAPRPKSTHLEYTVSLFCLSNNSVL